MRYHAMVMGFISGLMLSGSVLALEGPPPVPRQPSSPQDLQAWQCQQWPFELIYTGVDAISLYPTHERKGVFSSVAACEQNKAIWLHIPTGLHGAYTCQRTPACAS